MGEDSINRMGQYLTTEHFTLQGARGGFISESNSRLATYLTTVSGAVIALALIAQISGSGSTFLQFALVLFPIVLYVGLGTVLQLVTLSGADALYTQAINRIRHFYVTNEPDVEHFLSFPHHDDNQSIDRARALFASFRIRVMFSPVVQVILINSFLAGVFATVLAQSIAPTKAIPSFVVGPVGFIVAVGIHYILASRVESSSREELEYRFVPPNE
jgi:hypothetical protein